MTNKTTLNYMIYHSGEANSTRECYLCWSLSSEQPTMSNIAIYIYIYIYVINGWNSVKAHMLAEDVLYQGRSIVHLRKDCFN